MALELQIGVAANKTEIEVYDATCAYSTPDNEGGWGAPNIEVSTIVSATFEIWYPENDTDEADYNIDVFPYIPNVEGSGYRLTVDDHNIGVVIDGLYRFKLTLIDENDVEYTTSCIQLFTPEVDCCIQKRVSKIDTDNCDLDYDKETVRLNSLYKAMYLAYCEGDLCKVNRILKHLQRACECCC